MPGDANLDGKVDVGDLGILAANYGMANGATWAQGDFNGDGAVDVGDLGVLAANYGCGTDRAMSFSQDAGALGLTVGDTEAGSNPVDQSPGNCAEVGLPLVAGLFLTGLICSSLILKELEYNEKGV